MRILMVCMGNICRSPTAEAVLRAKLATAGIKDVEVDSAGTYGGHAGAQPDRRSQIVAQQRGYDLRGIHSRKLVAADSKINHLILVMDQRNYDDTLRLLAGDDEALQAQVRARMRHFLTFHPNTDLTEVPDPFTGEADGFRLVFDLIEETASNIVAEIENVRREFNGT